jgi:hypothetical protein
VTREDRRLARRLAVLVAGCIAVMIAMGYVSLWLYPPPGWMKGDAWYASNLCTWHRQIMPCVDAAQACIAEGKFSKEVCSRNVSKE